MKYNFDINNRAFNAIKNRTKRVEITELIVTNKIRSKGVGQELTNKMEEYFKSVGCEYVLIDVFSYNENAIKFYNKKGYHSRMYTDIKKL